MKSIKEVGIGKALKFVLVSYIEVIYRILTDFKLPFPQVRTVLLSLMGAKIGANSTVMKVRFANLHHKGLKSFKTGKDCFIGDETLIDLYDSVILEDQVTIAQRVTILTHMNVGYKDHPLQEYFPKESKGVTIKAGSVIGAASTILPGLTIGKESFVAAGSVVTEDVPERTLVGGVPAKPIRKIK